MKKAFKLCAIILGLDMLIVAIILIVLLTTEFSKPEFKIFVEMEEFSCIDEYITTSLPDESQYINGLMIADRLCVKVKYEGTDFDVYAYIFTSKDDANQYITEVRQNSNTAKWRYMVSKENRALFIKSSERMDGFLSYLFESFSETLDPPNIQAG